MLKEISLFNVVVIGYGSIGKRHVDNLISLGVTNITLVRSRLSGNKYDLNEINDLVEILKINPDFVILSTPTSLHFSSLKFLISNNINILSEKPLVQNEKEWTYLKKLLLNSTSKNRIIYNLRLHPCVQKVKQLLAKNKLGKINYSRFFVGQYLKDWRPNVNHLESYSSFRNKGGGVILDLVHEIDLAEYLLGRPKDKIFHISDKVSNVTVDSFDVSEIMYKTENKNIVNIHLDYLYKGYSRNFLINGSDFNLFCDLNKNTIEISGDSNKVEECYIFDKFKKNDMYLNVIRDFILCLNEGQTLLPSFKDNISVMKTCFKVNN